MHDLVSVTSALNVSFPPHIYVTHYLLMTLVRPCVQCAIANKEDCKHTCGGIKLTKVNASATLACFDETFHFNVEMDMTNGSVHIFYALKHSEFLYHRS